MSTIRQTGGPVYYEMFTLYSLAALLILGTSKLCILSTYTVHLARATTDGIAYTCVDSPINKVSDRLDLLVHV